MIVKTSKLVEKYKEVRAQTDEICSRLQVEDFVVQPVVDVSPPKWHLAHTTWFFENFILNQHKKKYQVFNKDFGFLFNSYYEEEGERTLRPERGFISRPGVEEIMKYRAYVDKHMLEFLDGLEDFEENFSELIELGLNHEEQHQELLVTDIKYILGHNPLFPVYRESPEVNNVPKVNFKENYLEFQDGIYDIGHKDKAFCFDNEKGAHNVYLHHYHVLDRLISNDEYMEFMAAGGYNNFRYWLKEGWDWVQKNKIKAPLYWHRIEKEWCYYTLSGLKKVNPYEPVAHVSFYEADAFAQWKGKRLLTEFEWENSCRKLRKEIPETSNFLEKGYYSPAPRVMESYQFYGDVWEWTSSAYSPYPYYKKADGAIGEYNGKFMINQMVLRGGSCATPIAHIRSTYRNFFHPYLRWQFSGIRLAESLE